MVRNFHDAQACGTQVARKVRSTSLPISPVNTTETSRHRTSSDDRVVVAHALPLPVGWLRMLDDDIDAVDGRMVAVLDVRPPQPEFPGAPRSAVSGSKGGTGIPSHTSRGLNSRRIAPRRRCDRGRRA